VDPSDGCVLASLRSDQQCFDRALKHVSCAAQPHSLAPALALAFRTLGKYRTQSGVDGLGRGLAPWNLEQAFVVVLTNDVRRLEPELAMVRDRQTDMCSDIHCMSYGIWG
jgi:hypothetical protein